MQVPTRAWRCTCSSPRAQPAIPVAAPTGSTSLLAALSGSLSVRGEMLFGE
jgi:hypothetical protein